MVSEINAAGGNFTVGDLVNYQLKFKDPIQGTYRGFKIYGAAPPISGGVCIVQALNMLENVKLEPTRRWSGDLAHITVELLKFAFANRLALGDPDFVNLTSIVPTMLDKEYAKKLFSRVNMVRCEFSDVTFS
jgi:gamma-glutamyltranspeptidase/glutathione hydrolase